MTTTQQKNHPSDSWNKIVNYNWPALFIWLKPIREYQLKHKNNNKTLRNQKGNDTDVQGRGELHDECSEYEYTISKSICMANWYDKDLLAVYSHMCVRSLIFFLFLLWTGGSMRTGHSYARSADTFLVRSYWTVFFFSPLTFGACFILHRMNWLKLLWICRFECFVVGVSSDEFSCNNHMEGVSHICANIRIEWVNVRTQTPANCGQQFRT